MRGESCTAKDRGAVENKSMSVALLASHAPRCPLKAKAWCHTWPMSVTLLTSHTPISWLDAEAQARSPCL